MNWKAPVWTITFLFVWAWTLPKGAVKKAEVTEYDRFASKQKGSRAEEHQVKRITFERSGGFVAAPSLNIKATVDLRRDGRAEVRAETAKYRRHLPPEEARKLGGMVDITNFFKLESDLRKQAVGGQVPNDQYQYDITVETDEGKQHTVVVGEQPTSELDRLAPGLGSLVEWIRNETRAIWNRKISQAP